VQDKQIETVSYGEEKATPGEACRQRSPRWYRARRWVIAFVLIIDEKLCD
jgi:hypothetical protein